ncbi:hypothetical protein ROHU_003926 [Labeo rohita]|uniref:Uncharacterized protein n=1 Tax=Labeo rohita TaxID=84645 RepID=A0A498NSB6_LABRO|nr:hypothetical protein ROHU_003926 [Labeo rohita]
MQTHAAAKAKLSRAEDSSDLQTDTEVPMKRKRLWTEEECNDQDCEPERHQNGSQELETGQKRAIRSQQSSGL